MSHFVVSGRAVANPRVSTPTACVLFMCTGVWRRREVIERFFKKKKKKTSEADLRFIHLWCTLFTKAGCRLMKPRRSWKIRVRIKKKKTTSEIKTPFCLIEGLLYIKEQQKPNSLSVSEAEPFPTRHLRARFWKLSSVCTVITHPALGLCLQSLPLSQMSLFSAFFRSCYMTSRFLFDSLYYH